MFTDLSPPPTEPVTLDEVKLFLRIDQGEEDALLEHLIRSARLQIEHRASLVMIERPVRIQVSARRTEVRLPLEPVHELISAKIDGEDIPAQLEARSHPPRVRFAHAPDAIVTFDLRAGFGPMPEDVPVPLRQAVLLLVADAFEHREREAGFDRTSLRIDALIGPYWGPRL